MVWGVGSSGNWEQCWAVKKKMVISLRYGQQQVLGALVV